MEIPGVGEARLVVLSPDQKSIALQQDERSVQFIDRTNGNTFVEVMYLRIRGHEKSAYNLRKPIQPESCRAVLHLKVFTPNFFRSVCQQVCKKPTKTILGLFFVECEEGNLVLVTSTGLELHRYSGGKKRLQLRNKLKQSIR